MQKNGLQEKYEEVLSTFKNTVAFLNLRIIELFTREVCIFPKKEATF